MINEFGEILVFQLKKITTVQKLTGKPENDILKKRPNEIILEIVFQ